MTQIEERILYVQEQIDGVFPPSKLEALSAEISNIEAQVGREDFWLDQESATNAHALLSEKKKLVSQVDGLRSAISDLSELFKIASMQQDVESLASIGLELSKLEEEVESLQTMQLLSGDHDERGALITVRAGAGGADATDFAEMLMRMYLRFSEKKQFRTRLLEVATAEGAGIRSAVIEVDAPYAYGRLSVEAGTHRLVRISPFNSAGKRHTSFAAVEVIPLIENSSEVHLDFSEVKVDVFRSSGPGGQSVNTTDSAVRLTHLPSGIVVSCQNEKSQLQNKRAAMRILLSRLFEAQRLEVQLLRKEMSGEVKASWGDQMRNYVLAPYRSVKDLRTGHLETDPQAVLNGDLDGLINAAIRWRGMNKN